MKMKPHQKYLPRGTVVSALDIGSSKMTCLIGHITDDVGGVEVVGVGHHQARGVANGTIADLDSAEAVVRQTVHAAENMAAQFMKGYPLREVVVNLPGVHAQSHLRRAMLDIGGHAVTDNDLRKTLVRAQDDLISEGSELVHTMVVNMLIDGHEGIREPRGMVGHDLGLDVHMVTGEQGALRNMAACVGRSHLDVSAFCLGSYAAGLATLVEDEMDLGATVIDMGAGVTSFAVFQSGAMIYADAVPLGGRHVSADIASGLTTGFEDSERIKILYGGAMATTNDGAELIDVPRVGESERRAPNHVPRAVLVGIIQPRLEEIFEMVRERLADTGLENLRGRRVVLTGGASQLTGMRDLAAHVLDAPVRLGKPIRVAGLPEAVSGPAFSTASGMLTYVAERSEEMPAMILSQVKGDTMLERVRLWFRENW